MAYLTNELVNKSSIKLLIKQPLKLVVDLDSTNSLAEEDSTNSLAEEFWKSGSVIGFSKYMGSSNGRIKNIERNFMLKGTIKNGYKTYTLVNDEGNQQFMSGHTFINYLFNGFPKNPNDTTDHINRIRDDNHSVNLRWASKIVQANNRMKPLNRKGRQVYQMDMEFNIIKRWDKILDAAKYLGIERRNIGRACKNPTKKSCGGYKWKYVDEDILDNEVWNIVPYENVPNLYASSLGRVKFGDRILEGYVHTDGYCHTKIKCIITGIVHSVKIHRLVAAAFYGISDLEVNHIDGNKINNKAENLEYVTGSENSKHAIALGLRTYKTRKVNQFTLDGEFVKTFDSIKDASFECGASSGNISNVCAGRNSQASGSKWEYVDLIMNPG